MGKEKPLEQGATNDPSFSSHAADWLNAFKRHFSIAFQDAVSDLSSDPDDLELQKAAVFAMSTTLRESGHSKSRRFDLAVIAQRFGCLGEQDMTVYWWVRFPHNRVRRLHQKQAG